MTRLTSRSATRATTAASVGFSISAGEPMAASNKNLPMGRNIYWRGANFNEAWFPEGSAHAPPSLRMALIAAQTETLPDRTRTSGLSLRLGRFLPTTDLRFLAGEQAAD